LQCAVAAFFHAAQVFVRSFIHVIRPFRFHVLVPSVDRIPRRLNHHPYRTYPRFRLPTASSSSSHSAPMRAPHGSAMVSIPRTGVKDAGSPQDVIPRGYAPSLEIPQQLPCSHPQSPPPPAAAASMPIFAKMIRAPFNYTLRFDSSGINVAMLSVPGRGHIYWGTSLFPRDDALIERGDPSTAPQPVRIAMRRCLSGSWLDFSTSFLVFFRPYRTVQNCIGESCVCTEFSRNVAGMRSEFDKWKTAATGFPCVVYSTCLPAPQILSPRS